MRKKIINIITMLALVTILVLVTGCSSEIKVNNTNDNIASDEKEGYEVGADEKKVLEGQVIEYKFDAEGKSGKVGELDLDFDGNKDTIELGKIESNKETGDESLEIKVNDSSVKFEECSIEQVVSAVAFDDKHILLATYADGMSADPHTSFYMYSNNKLEQVGDIENDIRTLNKKVGDNDILTYADGELSSWERQGTLSNMVIVKYKWDGSKLTMNSDGTFDYADQEEKIKVIKPIKIYEEPKKDSKSEEVDTSVIYPLKQGEESGEESWNYIKTKDGKEGWIDAFESDECFELLNVSG